ncbi:MAG: ATP-binding protein [Candidatus Woesearchaeota archaeon]
MIVGKIVGKTTTNSFNFEIVKQIFKYDYVQVWHEKYGYVLGQIYEIELLEDKAIGKCIILGYVENGILKAIKSPLKPNSEVLKASESDVRKFLKLNENGLYVGLLRDSSIPVYLDAEKIVTKHLAIIAKTGAGKSYTVGVIIEELIEKGIPIVIIDVHGEYNTLALENDNPEDLSLMPKFNITKKAYSQHIREYGNVNFTNAYPLTLKDEFTSNQLITIFKDLNAAQQSLIFECMGTNNKMSLQELFFSLRNAESNKKWTILPIIEEILKYGIFSSNYIPYNELVQINKVSIINLKGYDPKIQEIIVFKILYDLFELRKTNQIPPFFLIIEESHNFCPERNFGEKITSDIIRTIASEGRKFGTGLCVVSQRPSRIDKNVLSQCNTQIIMKVTNPNDIKSIIQSVEGIYENIEEELKNLQIGQALIAGVIDVPLIVEIRPRKSKHGGGSKLIPEINTKQVLEEFKQKEMLSIIIPKISEKDFQIMNIGKKIKKVLIPVVIFQCDSGEKKYNLLFELVNGNLVIDPDLFVTKKLPDLSKVSVKELNILEFAFKKGCFTLEDLIKNVRMFDVKGVLKSLVKQGLIIEKEEKYCLNEDFVFAELSNYEFIESYQYLEIIYDEKIEKKVEISKVAEDLSRYTNVVSHKEGYLLHYVSE